MTARAKPEGAHAHDVLARGARIRFVDEGEGPPIVLIHDFLSSQLEWDHVRPLLAASMRVVALDLPGFGASESPDPLKYRYTFDGFADSVTDVIAALGLGRVSICGRGMGAAVALTLAASHPDLIDCVVLVAPHVYPSRARFFERLAEVPFLGPLLFKQVYGRGFLRTYLGGSRGPHAGAARARLEEHLGRFDAPSTRQAAYATLLAMLDARPVVAKVPRVNAPCLIVWGREDPRAPVELGRKLSRELTHARLEVVDSGHSPAEDCPELVARHTLEFLETERSRARPNRRRKEAGTAPPSRRPASRKDDP
ncbi:MAG: alpha/beta hydrolase [Myxococcales bacterium]|jgi:pimeloyl-ACP methyl ester carboxylesterase|nr:alpha/beta hydrolase [Myxococcales bacterium]MBL0197251.1 alpha/beta hydrolase [Myxococcales bacterium]HQY62997.1 alpha/beta hydrolase [Polyangiaceae bacterium]